MSNDKFLNRFPVSKSEDTVKLLIVWDFANLWKPVLETVWSHCDYSLYISFVRNHAFTISLMMSVSTANSVTRAGWCDHNWPGAGCSKVR